MATLFSLLGKCITIVFQAALEAYAVLAQQLGPHRNHPLYGEVDHVKVKNDTEESCFFLLSPESENEN